MPPWQNCEFKKATHIHIHTIGIVLVYTHSRIVSGATEFVHCQKFCPRKGYCIAGSYLGEENGSAYGVIVVLDDVSTTI